MRSLIRFFRAMAVYAVTRIYLYGNRQQRETPAAPPEPPSFYDEPEWLVWAEKHRPFPTPTSTEAGVDQGLLRVPFEGPLHSNGWSQNELLKFIHLQLGLELPKDLSKVFITWDGYQQLGPIDLTDEVCREISGMVGFDRLHSALLIICCATASAVHEDQTNGVRAANLIYYAATAGYVGPANDPRESQCEAAMWQLEAQGIIRSLQDACAFVFHYFDWPHMASSEYLSLDHHQFWGW